MKKRHGPKGYEFNADFMQEAYLLYCQGIGGGEIAERMHDEWPTVCRQTVARIIKKFGWEKQRDRYIQNNVCGVEERQKAMELLQKTRERLERLTLTSENHQHFAQLLRTMEMQGKLLGWFELGEEGIVLSNNLEMNAYLAAIEEVMGVALNKARREIKKIYEEKLKSGGKNKK